MVFVANYAFFKINREGKNWTKVEGGNRKNIRVGKYTPVCVIDDRILPYKYKVKSEVFFPSYPNPLSNWIFNLF